MTGNGPIFQTLVLSIIGITSLIPIDCVSLHDAVRVRRLDKVSDGVDGPLFLTPYIKEGRLAEAKKNSKVELPAGIPSISYSGYLTVNETYNSNLFFWYFPAQKKPSEAPVILWLQGGPGSSSLFGVFVEHGPFHVTSDLNILLRNTTWVESFHMIYVDNPVGAGFSFTENENGYAKSQPDVARDLYSALPQFFTIFSEIAKNDFYVAGESYAGKFATSLAHEIHSRNPSAKMAAINMKGVIIGVGFCDPESLMNFGEHLHQISLIDQQQLEHFNQEQSAIVKDIQTEQWSNAISRLDELFFGYWMSSPHHSYYENVTGLVDYSKSNYLYDAEPKAFRYFMKYLNNPEVKKAIHVGNNQFRNMSTVQGHLLGDLLKSVKPWLVTLMDNYRVLFYTGQLDMFVNSASVQNFLSSIKWKNSEKYQTAKRQVWRVFQHGDQMKVAGYVKQADDFYSVVVRNGGHFPAYDQPERLYDLMKRFIFKLPFV